MKKTISVCVVASNANGSPTLQFYNIAVTAPQFNEGHHYELAKQLASSYGYEPVFAFDQQDQAWRDLSEYAMSVVAQEAAPVAVHITVEGGQIQHVCADSKVTVNVYDNTEQEATGMPVELRQQIYDSYTAGLTPAGAIVYPKAIKGDIEEMARKLAEHGYKVGERDLAVNPKHEGAWMVVDAQGGEGSYAVVGNSRAELVKEAYESLIEVEPVTLPPNAGLSQSQISALNCLDADLQGLSEVIGTSGTIRQAHTVIQTYDWNALGLTAKEVATAFPWVTEQGINIPVPAKLASFWAKHGEVITAATALAASTKKPLITHSTPPAAYAFFAKQIAHIVSGVQ